MASMFSPSSRALGASIDKLDVYSKSMNQTFRAAVVVPDEYHTEHTAFPVLYLLHGGGGDVSSWLTQVPDVTLLPRLAAQYNILIVIFDGGEFSYYFDSPLDPTSQRETFISQELLTAIDEKYRTVRSNKGRLITGASMGGHGAMLIASRHPHLYAAAGSISGVMDLNTKQWTVGADFARQRDEIFASMLGPPQPGDHPYPEHSMVALADKLQTTKLPLIFDVGVDDFLIKTNRDLHQRLLANHTPHVYTERPGGHQWSCFATGLASQMLFFNDVLLANKVAVPPLKLGKHKG